MDIRKLTAIIPMVSGCIMLIWGLLANDWSKCWIVVVIGGVLSGIIAMLTKDQDKKEDKKEE